MSFVFCDSELRHNCNNCHICQIVNYDASKSAIYGNDLVIKKDFNKQSILRKEKGSLVERFSPKVVTFMAASENNVKSEKI